jgi:uncharacterized membrane protein YjjP (DUF1212 family)
MPDGAGAEAGSASHPSVQPQSVRNMSAKPAPEQTTAGAASDENAQPVEIALDAALLVMKNGGTTIAAARCFDDILGGYGQKDVAAVWRLDFVAATAPTAGRPRTYLRPVGPIGVNLVRVSEALMLGQRAASGELPASYIEQEVERVSRLPSPYNRWALVLVAAATGACFSRLPCGDWGSFAIAFVAAGAGQLLRSALQARKLGVAPVMLLSALLSAMIAALGLRLGYSDVKPATMMASIIYLVPGLALINGFLDAVSHRYLFVGVERMLNAVFLFLVLALALAIADNVVL